MDPHWFFEILINNEPTFPKNMGECFIDKEKADQYLSLINDVKLRKITNDIIKETEYVPSDKLIVLLEKSLNQAIEKYNKFYLFLHRRDSSSYWFIHIFADILKNHTIGLVFEDDNLNFKLEYPILVLDDCIYSGTNYLSYLDQMTFEKEYPILNWISCTAYINLNLIKELEIVTSNNYVIKSDLFYERGLYPAIDYEIDEELFSEKPGALAIYHDHKIPHKQSSFPEIYLDGKIPQWGILWDSEEKTGNILNAIPDRSPIRHTIHLLKDFLESIPEFTDSGYELETKYTF